MAGPSRHTRVVLHSTHGQGARVGLVLGAGGEDGGAFIRGALSALNDLAGWHPSTATTVIGTSIGALRAAHIRGPDTVSNQSIHPDVMAGLEHISGGLGPLNPLWSDRVVVPGRRLGGRLLALGGPAGQRVASYPVASEPYHPGLRTIAVVRRSGTRHITQLATSDQPTKALYASAAIPGSSAPVTIDGTTLIDGAVYSSTNADLVSPHDHDLLVVLAPMVTTNGGPWLSRTHRALLADELKPWRRAHKPVVVVAPDVADLRLKRDHEAYSAVAYGRVVTAYETRD